MGFKGDYDFTLATLVPVLFIFGDEYDVLFPETREHLLHTLLVERDEESGWDLTGGDPRLTAPGSFGLVPETENHILMTEGSRYLKNQWMREKEGRTENAFDNLENGLEHWLLGYLDEIREFGWDGYNPRGIVGRGGPRPHLFFWEVPPERSELAIESWGLGVDGSGLSVSRGLPGEDPELFTGTVEVTDPPDGIYWIAGYASEQKQTFGFRVRYSPQARTFAEWDLWMRGTSAARSHPLAPGDSPPGSQQRWWERYALPQGSEGKAVYLDEGRVQFRVRADAEDLEYLPERSGDLRFWCPFQAVVHPGSVQPWKVLRGEVDSGDEQEFYRLRVAFRPDGSEL